MCLCVCVFAFVALVCVNSLGFPICRITSTVNIVVVLHFQRGYHLFIYLFIYLSSLTALARISSTVVSRSGEGGHPCLAADLREKSSQSHH